MKTNTETVRAAEKICSCVQEQAVELDHVLPDYCPEIFRIVKCFADTEITSSSFSGGRLNYELTVILHIIYCPENSSIPECVEQKLSYSRTVTLEKECENPIANIKAYADNITCRAVNKRRIDVRGAISIRITVTGETKTEVISSCFGGNIQLKKKSCRYPSAVIRTQRRITVSDEFELPEDTSSIGTILRCDAQIISADKKIVSGKAAAKGELKISVLCTSSEDEDIFPLQFSLPFSNLIDIEGADESFDCIIMSEVISCTATPKSDGSGHSRMIECDVMMLAECTAVKTSVCEIACDEYSTMYASSHETVSVKISRDPIAADSVITVKGTCENKESPLTEIYDTWCSTDKLNTLISDGRLKASGNVIFCVCGKTESGGFTVCETEVPVDEVLAVRDKAFSDDAQIRITFSPVSCTYTFSPENKAEIKAEIAVRGYIADNENIDAISEVTVDETTPIEKNNDYALKLYFADDGEDIWDIAKASSASVEAIMEENELDSSTVDKAGMLLIPME